MSERGRAYPRRGEILAALMVNDFLTIELGIVEESRDGNHSPRAGVSLTLLKPTATRRPRAGAIERAAGTSSGRKIKLLHANESSR